MVEAKAAGISAAGEIKGIGMSKLVNVAKPDEEAVFADQLWDRVVAFLEQLRLYYRLFFVFLAVFALLTLAMYLVVEPAYTATATIGPPGASPVNSLITDGTGSSVKKLLGAASGAGQNDPFQEYLQVLHSSRLAIELSEKDNLLRKVFSDRWDAVHQRWKPPSATHVFVAGIERALHRPVTDHPDADTLADVLAGNFHVAEATSSTSSLLSMGSSFMVASAKGSSPEDAESLLNVVLSRADSIIRQEQQRDVLARIAYIEGELPHVTEAEQRDALIEILSSQEELNTMMVADKRFAFTLVDPPHSSPIPAFPPRPTIAVLLATLAAFGFFALTVFLQTRSRLLKTMLAPFASYGRSKAPNRPIEHGQQVPQAR